MLGWLKPSTAVADLARLLSDPDPAVQAQAAWALGEMGTEPARLVLLPAPNIPAPNPAPILAPVAARPVALAPLAELPMRLPMFGPTTGPWQRPCWCSCCSRC